MNELGQWVWSALPDNLSFSTTDGLAASWYAGAQFAFALNNSGQHLYRWDEYFAPAQFVKELITGVKNNAQVGIYEATISINSLDLGKDVKGMRWDGVAWKSQFFNSNLNYTSSAAGNDFIVRRDLNDGSIKRFVFDPNLDNWVEHSYHHEYGKPLLAPVQVSANACAWFTNGVSQNSQAKIYSVLPNGWGDPPTAISSFGAWDHSLKLGNNFYVYEDWYPSGGGSTYSGTQVGLFKNGQWNSTPDVLDDYQLPASTEQLFTYSIVTRNSSTWDSSTQLHLYRVVDDNYIGPLTDLAVSSVAIFDGYETVTTSYQYNAAKALFDPSGNVAQYNEITVTPGSGYNGYTKHYFFNGLPAAELAVPYPPNDAYTNADSFYSHLRGLEYKTAAYNWSGASVVSVSTKYWKVFHRWLRANEEGTYVRLMKESSTIDGVEKVVENTYNTLGLTTETKTYNYNWDGNLDTHTQTFKYWYEAYDTDLSENFFTPVIQTTTKTNTTTTSVSATTWKEWFTGKWAPHKSYQWDGNGSSSFDFTNWSGAGEPSSGWLKTSEVVTVTTEGAVLQTKNIDQIYQSTIVDYPKLRPIASFSNARISQTSLGSEASFVNFESNLNTSEAKENDYWGLYTQNSFSTIAHTGKYSRKLRADVGEPNYQTNSVYGPTRDFRPPDLAGQQRQYVLSCWVRTQTGFGANKGQLIIHSKQDSDADNSVYPNVTGAYVYVNFSDTQGQWQYLEAVLDLKQVRSDGLIADGTLLRLRCFPVNYDDTHYLLVDDLRLSPVDAPFSATVYDPDFDLVTATLGANGETMRSVYDNFQRPIATVGPNENVTAVSAPYYSRSGNNDAFAPNDPNSSLSASARNGGIFDDFNDGDANGWDLSDGNWTITADGKLKNTGVDASDHAVLSNFSYANYGVAAQVKHLAGAANFGIKIGNILVQWIGKWELRDGGTFVKDETVTPLTDNWLLITSDRAVLFFADGKLIFKEIRPATISGQLKLYTGVAGTQVTFDDILVFRDPQLGITYLDGAGKTRQTQTLNGVTCQVAETVYDGIGRSAVQTKTAQFSNTLFGFRPNFVTGLNWTTGVMTGEVADYYSLSGGGYSNDNGYPYTREVYENSPLSRLTESGLPGQDFAVGQGHTAWAQYSNNLDGTFVGTTLASGPLPVYQYFVKTDLSPDGIYSYTLTDQAGHLIAEKIDSNDGGIDPTTSYEYDDFGRLVRTRLPNYYNPPTAGDWTIYYTCDFFGRLKQKTTPDAQATYFYIYDKAGRMRFVMDANGGAQNPDHIQYWKYDTLGRAIECGYIIQDWNATILQNYADTNPTWPSTPTTWRKKYTYDYNGTTPYLKGRLYKVETNNDSDTSAEVEETFAYDIYGNVLNKTAKVLDYNASSYGIIYEYDHGGNVTRMTYIPASLVLQNETVTGIISYSAADSITAGPAYTVASGANVVLQAGKKIRLVPGFTAQQGSYFNAKIDPFLTQDATVVTYSYDALGRLISVGTPSDADFYAAYTYHADGRLNTEILANGAETRNHFYNSPGWLLRIDGDRFTEDITHTTGWGGAAGYYDGRIKTTSFVYNWAGKPADYAVQYTYDDVGQLTSADNNLNNAWDIGIGNTISYDANGNILDLTRGSTTKNYAYYTGTNKVQNTDGSGNDYGYDSNANVITSSPKSINTIAYDSFTQRPMSVSMSSGASLTMQYGSDTQRVLKNYTSGGSTNSKLYLHGQSDYPLIEKNKTSAAAETLAVYIYGLNGTVAKRVGSTVLFPLKDHLGSTRVVMDANGLVRTYYDYDALGNIIRIGTTNEVKYQFTGQEVDESSLHNYRARLYDSDLGKFYAVDPAGQGWSPFAYAGNNPVIFVDADGRAWFLPVIIGIGILSGGYSGYQIAEAKGESGLNALGYVLAGAAIGGVSAYLGATSAAQVGGVFSGGISTFTNSFGMMMLSGGQTELSSQLGPLTISEKGFKLANPFKDRGALRSLLGWATLAGDLYSLYGHYRENQRISREVPELSGRNKEVEQMWEDSLNPNRHPRGKIHEEGAWMSKESFSRVPPGEGSTIDLGPKPDWATSNIHTHPNFGIDPISGKEWAPGGSPMDRTIITNQKIVQAVVVAGKHNQIHVYYTSGTYPIGAFDKFVYKWWFYKQF